MLKPTCKVIVTGAFANGGLRGRAAALLSGPNQVNVGFPAGKVSAEIAQKAIWNEFGTRGGASGGGWGGPIPERPFMRNAMRANRAKYAAFMASASKQVLLGVFTGKSIAGIKRDALANLGALAQGDIQAEITALRSPPNSPVTVKLKGSSKPLIDSGELRASVTWEITD